MWMYQTVQDNMSQVQRKIKKRKLEEGKAVVMQVGDRVLRQNKRSLQRKGGKHKYCSSYALYCIVNVSRCALILVMSCGYALLSINEYVK